MATEKPPKPRPDDAEAYPYVLTNQIGEGSFATVYRGYHVKNRRAVAVKAVKTSILKAKLLDNLESEIAILKSMNHRHITALIDIVKAEKHVYIVMDYCSGGDLSQYIKARGKIETLQYIPAAGSAPIYYPHPKSGGLDQKVVRSLLLQLADALRFLRDLSLMHRDLKPQNLLLQPAAPDDIALGHTLGAPILKVADFGFARILPTASLAETLCGSPLYMAPEILSYEKYDAKADLWSVGAVLYEMSVGRPPFRANNHIELLNKINRANSRVPFPDEDPAKATTATPVPTDIKQLIRMLLRRNPVERADYDEFFRAPALEGLSRPFFTHAHGLPAINPAVSAPPGPRTAIPNVALLATSRPPPHSPSTAPTSPTTSVDPSSATTQDMQLPIGPDGQPYDPRHYTYQDTFQLRRKKHRDKDDKRRRSERTAEVSSSGGVADLDSAHAAGDVGRRPSGRSSPLLRSVDVEGVLRQDYVVVDDTRAVEFNRVADEIEAARHRPSLSRKRISTANNPEYTPASRTTQPPSFRPPSDPGSDGRTGAEAGTPEQDAAYPPAPPPPPPPPPFATTYRRNDSSTSPTKKEYTFPPAPAPQISTNNNGTALATPLLIKPPASALARALNIASKKLFGSPTNVDQASSGGSPGSVPTSLHNRRESDHYYYNSSNGNSPRIVAGQLPDSDSASTKTGNGNLNGLGLAFRGEGTRLGPHAQEELLAQLEEVAKKAHVLAEWADKKFDKVAASPSKPLPDPAAFEKRKGEAPHRAESRRKREMEMETHAIQCVSLYFTVMSFAQKAIELIRAYYRSDDSHTPSPGIDTALTWARDAFARSTEKVNTIKAWLPEGYNPRHMWIDRVIYDHALSLLRHAASLELRAENFKQCEEEYERALWMLFAIQDDVVQSGNPYADQDRETISNFVATTKTRLTKLRQRLAQMKLSPPIA